MEEIGPKVEEDCITRVWRKGRCAKYCNFCKTEHNAIEQCVRTILCGSNPRSVYLRCPCKTGPMDCYKSFPSEGDTQFLDNHITLKHSAQEALTAEKYKSNSKWSSYCFRYAISGVPRRDDPVYNPDFHSAPSGMEFDETFFDLANTVLNGEISEHNGGNERSELEWENHVELPSVWHQTYPENSDSETFLQHATSGEDIEVDFESNDTVERTPIQDGSDESLNGKTRKSADWKQRKIQVLFTLDGETSERVEDRSEMYSLDGFEALMESIWVGEVTEGVEERTTLLDSHRETSKKEFLKKTSEMEQLMLSQLSSGISAKSADLTSDAVRCMSEIALKNIVVVDRQGRKVDLSATNLELRMQKNPSTSCRKTRALRRAVQKYTAEYTGRLIEVWVPVPEQLRVTKHKLYKKILMRDILVLIHSLVAQIKRNRVETDFGALSSEQQNSVQKDFARDIQALGIKIFSDATVVSFSGLKKTPVSIVLNGSNNKSDYSKSVLCYFEPMPGESKPALRSWEARVSVWVVFEILAVVQRVGQRVGGFDFPGIDKRVQIVLSGWIGDNLEQQAIVGMLSNSCRLCGSRYRGNSRRVEDAGELGNLPLQSHWHSFRDLKESFEDTKTAKACTEFELMRRVKKLGSYDVNPILNTTLNFHASNPFLLFPPDLMHTLLGGPVKECVETVFRLVEGKTYDTMAEKVDVALQPQLRLVSGLKLYGWRREDPTTRMEMRWWPVECEILQLLILREARISERNGNVGNAEIFLNFHSTTKEVYLLVFILNNILHLANAPRMLSKEYLQIGVMLTFIFDLVYGEIRRGIGKGKNNSLTRTLKSHMVCHWFQMMYHHGPSHTFDTNHFEHAHIMAAKRMRNQVNNVDNGTAFQHLNRIIEADVLRLKEKSCDAAKVDSHLVQSGVRKKTIVEGSDFLDILMPFAKALNAECTPKCPHVPEIFRRKEVTIGQAVEVHRPDGTSFRLSARPHRDNRGLQVDLPSVVAVRENGDIDEDDLRKVFIFAAAIQVEDSHILAMLVPQTITQGEQTTITSTISQLGDVKLDIYHEFDLSFEMSKEGEQHAVPVEFRPVNDLISLRAYKLFPDFVESKKIILFSTAGDLKEKPERWLFCVRPVFHRSMVTRVFLVFFENFTFQTKNGDSSKVNSEKQEVEHPATNLMSACILLTKESIHSGVFEFESNSKMLKENFVKVDVDDDCALRIRLCNKDGNNTSEPLKWRTASPAYFSSDFESGSNFYIKRKGVYGRYTLQYDYVAQTYFVQSNSISSSGEKKTGENSTILVTLFEGEMFERTQKGLQKIDALT